MDDTYPVPAFCRLEYWNAKTQDWVVGHAGVALLHPKRYVERLEANGKIGRVTLIDTGEVYQTVFVCPHCGDAHAEPQDGSCLI